MQQTEEHAAQQQPGAGSPEQDAALEEPAHLVNDVNGLPPQQV